MKPILTTTFIIITFIDFSMVFTETIREIIAIPFQVQNNLPYVTMYANSKRRAFSISTCLYQSVLFKGQSSSLDKQEESSNVYYDTYNTGPNIKVPISFEYWSNDQMSSIELSDYEFILLIRKANESIFTFQPENFTGVIALPRRSIHYHDSLLRKLYLRKSINSITFALNYVNKYLALGTLDDLHKSFISMGNDKTSCMLYILDNKLYSEWACKASYIIIGEDYHNYTSKQFIKAHVNVVFEPMIDNIIIPIKYKNEVLNQLIGIEHEVFDTECKIITQTTSDESYYHNRINNINLKLFYIKCTNNDLTSISSFTEHLHVNTFNVVINGIVYSFKGNELFYQSFDDKNIFYSSFLFSETGKNYMILGNLFLGKLNGIIFDDESSNIYFFNKEPPVNIQAFTHDEPEKRSAQFFLFTVISVILLIIVALLIPYYFYRRSNKKMLDRLNYEIIYKRVNDIRKSLLHPNDP